MATKLFLLIVIAVTFIETCCAEEPAEVKDGPPTTICEYMERARPGIPCQQCNFLTFGQGAYEITGLIKPSFYCPDVDQEKTHCCYNPIRQPFCCSLTIYLLTGFVWVVAVIGVIVLIVLLIIYLYGKFSDGFD